MQQADEMEVDSDEEYKSNSAFRPDEPNEHRADSAWKPDEEEALYIPNLAAVIAAFCEDYIRFGDIDRDGATTLLGHAQRGDLDAVQRWVTGGDFSTIEDNTTPDVVEDDPLAAETKAKPSRSLAEFDECLQQMGVRAQPLQQQERDGAMPRRRGRRMERMNTIEEHPQHDGSQVLAEMLLNKKMCSNFMFQLEDGLLKQDEFEEISRKLSKNIYGFLRYLRKQSLAGHNQESRRSMVRGISKICRYGNLWDLNCAQVLVQQTCAFFNHVGVVSFQVIDVRQVATRVFELAKYLGLGKTLDVGRMMYENRRHPFVVNAEFAYQNAYRHFWHALVDCAPLHYIQFLGHNLAEGAIRRKRVYLVTVAMYLKSRESNGRLPQSDLEPLVVLLSRRQTISSIAADQNEIPHGADQKIPGTELLLSQGGGATLVKNILGELEKSPDVNFRKFGRSAIYRGILSEIADLVSTENGLEIIKMMVGSCSVKKKGLIADVMFGQNFHKMSAVSFERWKEIRESIGSVCVSRATFQNMENPVFKR